MDACYGNAVVLDRLSFFLAQGSSLTILGRNGVGKTRCWKRRWATPESLAGHPVVRPRHHPLPSHRRVHAGLGWVPQGREVFPSLTVEENLTVIAHPGEWNLHRVYDLFPRLRERRGNYGNQLSRRCLDSLRAAVLSGGASNKN